MQAGTPAFTVAVGGSVLGSEETRAVVKPDSPDPWKLLVSVDSANSGAAGDIPLPLPTAAALFALESRGAHSESSFGEIGNKIKPRARTRDRRGAGQGKAEVCQFCAAVHMRASSAKRPTV